MHEASHSVADLVIKGVDVSTTVAKSAVSTILQLPPLAHLQNAYDMYTLGEEVGDGIAIILPKEEDGFTIVIDTHKSDTIPVSSAKSVEKAEKKSSGT